MGAPNGARRPQAPVSPTLLFPSAAAAKALMACPGDRIVFGWRLLLPPAKEFFAAGFPGALSPPEGCASTKVLRGHFPRAASTKAGTLIRGISW